MLTEWLGETSIVGMVLGGSLIAKLVLLILALMSALSWAIIIIKALQYHNIRKEDQKVLSNLPERVQPESNQKSFFRVSFFCFFIHFFCHLSGGSANESTNSAFFS